MGTRGVGKGLGRRDILRNAGSMAATAALMSAVRASFPGGAFAQAAGPETNKVTLGFIALTDSSPLIVAKERSSSTSTASPMPMLPSRPRGARRAITSCWAPARAASMARIS